MLETVYRLTDDEVLAITLDARVVAIRWDVIPWSLVLDLDTPTVEEDPTEMRRTWICFDGVSEFTWLFSDTRLPTGCWLTSAIGISPLPNGSSEFSFAALIPQFNEDDTVKENPAKDVFIKSMRILGASSKASAPPAEYGLTWTDRMALATDQEFIDVLTRETDRKDPSGENGVNPKDTS
jgi:hypothetical protein